MYNIIDFQNNLLCILNECLRLFKNVLTNYYLDKYYYKEILFFNKKFDRICDVFKNRFKRGWIRICKRLKNEFLKPPKI